MMNGKKKYDEPWLEILDTSLPERMCVSGTDEDWFGKDESYGPPVPL